MSNIGGFVRQSHIANASNTIMRYTPAPAIDVSQPPAAMRRAPTRQSKGTDMQATGW